MVLIWAISDAICDDGFTVASQTQTLFFHQPPYFLYREKEGEE